MMTCTLTCRIDPCKLAAFEAYAKVSASLVPRTGKVHCGYCPSHEGANDVAWAPHSVIGRATLETCCGRLIGDPKSRSIFDLPQESSSTTSDQRSFINPALAGAGPVDLGMAA